MSTEYYTDPPIKYGDFIQAESLDILEATKKIYVSDHKLIKRGSFYVHVFADKDGNARFERFGRNKVDDIFSEVTSEFNVKVFDEYGCEWEPPAVLGWVADGF